MRSPVFRLLASIVLLLITGCGTLQRKTEVPPEPVPNLVHTVSYRGETLGLIAKWYTGDCRNWTKLAQQNPQIKAHRIQLGDTLTISAALLINRKPLPEAQIRGESRASLARQKRIKLEAEAAEKNSSKSAALSAANKKEPESQAKQQTAKKSESVQATSEQTAQNPPPGEVTLPQQPAQDSRLAASASKSEQGVTSSTCHGLQCVISWLAKREE